MRREPKWLLPGPPRRGFRSIAAATGEFDVLKGDVVLELVDAVVRVTQNASVYDAGVEVALPQNLVQLATVAELVDLDIVVLILVSTRRAGVKGAIEPARQGEDGTPSRLPAGLAQEEGEVGRKQDLRRQKPRHSGCVSADARVERGGRRGFR